MNFFSSIFSILSPQYKFIHDLFSQQPGIFLVYYLMIHEFVKNVNAAG